MITTQLFSTFTLPYINTLKLDAIPPKKQLQPKRTKSFFLPSQFLPLSLDYLHLIPVLHSKD